MRARNRHIPEVPRVVSVTLEHALVMTLERFGFVMTLVIALKKYETEKEAKKRGVASLCVFSDSKETFGNELLKINRKCQKVYQILAGKLYAGARSPPLAIWSGAGDSRFLKKGEKICETVLKNMYKKEWKRTPPTFDQFEIAVETIEHNLSHKFKEYDRQKQGFDLEMILGSVDHDGRVSLYRFDNEGVAESLHDDPGYAIQGFGYLTGANLLLNMLGYDLRNSWQFDAFALIAFVIDRVSEIDPTVGRFEGDGCQMWLEKNRVVAGPLKLHYLNQYKALSQSRTDLIRSLWRSCDKLGDKEVSRELARLQHIAR